MRVGIRDILGRDDVRDTHRTLSDVAEICLKTSARYQYEKLLENQLKLQNDMNRLKEENEKEIAKLKKENKIKKAAHAESPFWS